tara:strand:+ start:314 stop:1282 length:969 start_codon:yes stop_codon:yes gene_type:complete
MSKKQTQETIEERDHRWDTHIGKVEKRVASTRSVTSMGDASAQLAEGRASSEGAKTILTNAVIQLIVVASQIFEELGAIEPVRRFLSRVHNASYNKAYHAMNVRLKKMKENFAEDPDHYPDPTVRADGESHKEDAQWRGEATRNIRNQRPAYEWFLGALDVDPTPTLQWAVPRRSSGNLVEGIPDTYQTASLAERVTNWQLIFEKHLLGLEDDKQSTVYVGSDPNAEPRLYYPMPKGAKIEKDDEDNEYFHLVLQKDQGEKKQTKLLREKWTLKRYHNYLQEFAYMPGYLSVLGKFWDSSVENELPDESEIGKCKVEKPVTN